MELKQFPTLKEHLEYMLGVKAGIREPLTEHCEGLKEITEDFFILNSQLAEYGIKGMIKNHYLGKCYKFEERDTSMIFRRENDTPSPLGDGFSRQEKDSLEKEPSERLQTSVRSLQVNTNEELHVNLTYSPSSILITVLDLSS